MSAPGPSSPVAARRWIARYRLLKSLKFSKVSIRGFLAVMNNIYAGSVSGLVAVGPAGSSRFIPRLGVREKRLRMNTQANRVECSEGLVGGLTRYGMATRFIVANLGAVKRRQSMYRGTLVAQSVFRAFRTGVVRSARGWPDRIGEDIVLTWALLGEGHQVVHEPTAIAFTRVPETLRGFYRQRQRWARGMIEALKSHLGMVWRRRRLASLFVALDLRIRRNTLGFLAYFLIYQFIVSPICVVGYTRELLNLEKRW